MKAIKDGLPWLLNEEKKERAGTKVTLERRKNGTRTRVKTVSFPTIRATSAFTSPMTKDKSEVTMEKRSCVSSRFRRDAM